MLTTFHVFLLLFTPMYPSNFSTSRSSNFMCSFHMLSNTFLACETSRAQVTLEGLFSSVCPLMRFQINLCFKHLSTETTLEFGGLMAHQMFLKDFRCTQLQSAFLTLRPIFLRKMNADFVVLQFSIGREGHATN